LPSSPEDELTTFIRKLKTFIRSKGARDEDSMDRSKIILEQPDYFNRHGGRNFLVCGSGPSVETYNRELKALAKDQNLITITASGVLALGEPDYMGFVNRYRFNQYARSTKGTKTKGLISVLFSDVLIKKYFHEEYELVMWDKVPIAIQAHMEPNGVFYNNGPGGVWLIWIAYAMGAERVYVSGIDGWTKLLENNQETSYLKGRHSGYKPWLGKEKIIERQHYWDDIQGISLQQVRSWLLEAKRIPFQIITPTAYKNFYDPAVLNL
jgi:hypothetical protein